MFYEKQNACTYFVSYYHVLMGQSQVQFLFAPGWINCPLAVLSAIFINVQVMLYFSYSFG